MTNIRDNLGHDGRDREQPDGDARLTAYALGELEGEERRAVEAQIAADPAARALASRRSAGSPASSGPKATLARLVRQGRRASRANM